MNRSAKLVRSRVVIFVLSLSVSCVLFSRDAASQVGLWATHSHDAQHTAVSSVTSQPLSTIHWHVPVDLAPPTGEIFIHYGSPLITAANTVIVPVKTGANSFRVEAHNGATGKRLWTQTTKYVAPNSSFFPGLGPTISGSQLFVPDIAGRILVRQNPDQVKGAVT